MLQDNNAWLPKTSIISISYNERKGKTVRFYLIALVSALLGTILASGALAAVDFEYKRSDTITLDEIMDSYRLDQFTPGTSRGTWSTVKPGEPLGQTFITGPNAITLSRIAVWVAHWNDQWTPEKSLVLSVWDSPNRNQKLGSFAMPHRWKNWESGVMVFNLGSIPVEPNTTYYFELTGDGGDGIIDGIYHTDGSYPHGQMFIAGQPKDGDLWFETHIKTPFDRDAEYQAQFDNWNLDFPGLERVKAAVEAKDWDTAVLEIVRYYESREDLMVPKTPRVNPDYDRSYDDLVADMKIKDQEGTIWELGPDWNHYTQWPLRGGVGLTRTGIRKNLAGGYLNTADEKFAIAWNDMILKNMRDMPSPLKAGAIDPNAKDINPAPPPGIRGGSMWNALSIGARMGQTFYYYQSVATSPNFTLDARAALIFNVVDMANVIAVMRGGGNWQTQMMDTLFDFGQTHPELKQSRVWFEKGFRELLINARETVHPDGSLWEASINYHGLVANRYLGLLESADKLDLEIPRWYRRSVERMLEYVMYMPQPNLKIPATGDTFGPADYGPAMLARGVDIFGREDFRWMATRRMEGHPPASLSVAFPHSGWWVMRTSWAEDAVYALLRNGPSRGHGHNDSLQMVMFAYGSELLIDPGIYVYGTPEANALISTAAHSTITVDGRNAHIAAKESSWESNSAFDYFDGTNAGYQGLDNVNMRRRVLFAKPNTFILVDDVTGPGSRELVSRFVCPQGHAEVQGSRAVFRDGRNGLLLTTPENHEPLLSITEGKRPSAGDKLVPIPVITRTVKSELPYRLVQVLTPFQGNRAPEVRVRIEEAAGADLVVVVENSTEGKTFRATIPAAGAPTLK